MIAHEKNITLTFQEQEEEVTSIFLLEDLLKEYNSQMISKPFYRPKTFLSLRNRFLDANNPIIRPMTQAEIESMHAYDLAPGNGIF